MDRQRPRYLRLPFVVLLILVALLPGGLARPQVAPGAAQGPAVTLDPPSGMPGSLVSISAMYLPATTTGLSAGIGFEVDGQQVVVGQQTIVACLTSRVLIYGFGSDCSGNDVTFQVPGSASPGEHTVTVAGSFLDFVGHFAYSSTFTVLASPSDTPTATDSPTQTATATDTPTQTATATASSQPSSTSSATDSPTATPSQTGTAQPAASATATASTTPTRAVSPSATALRTVIVPPQPKAAEVLVLARPAFAAGTLLVSMHVQPEATIHIVFTVGHANKGQAMTDYLLAEDGKPDGRGRFAALLRVTYRKPGQAKLIVSIRTGSVVQTVRRQYQFSPG
jgi:hypothetical protein